MNLDTKTPDWKLVAGAGAGSLIIIKLIMMGIESFAIGTMQMMMIAMAGALGFFLGWFGSPQARPFRIAMMVIIAGLLLLMGIGDAGPAGVSITSMYAFAAFIVGLLYWVGGVVRAFATPPTTFGSAEWATLPYLEDKGIIGETGIRLGVFPAGVGDDDRHRPIHYASDRHLLTIAPTRSGKGTTAIIPNLLTYQGSALVIDPKGENAMITAARREAMGQDVYVVDPWMITTSSSIARFNPLDWLEAGDIDITENAMLLADALVVPDGSGESFWMEEAKALLQGIILYVATDSREAGNRHLGRVRDLLLLDGDDMKLLFERMLESHHHIVISTGARCLQKEEKLLANVVASAQAQTHFLDSARIRDSLASSDFKFEDLKGKAMTIYLVLPSDRLNAFSRWLRLLIQQAITVNARNIAIKPEKPVLFLLDEMPALGRLTMVEQAFGLMAGFGIQLWGIVQDVSQLKGIYGDGWETFIGNSGMIQYFGSRDRMTADYFSALCGVTTVWNLSSAIARAFSSSSGQGGMSSSSSTTTTETTSASQRQLAYADELMRMHETKELILIENLNPIIGTKVRWFEDDGLKALGRNLHDGN
ncbi:type IV secretory system conjugative DNA transfer family protein [Erythrobacter donghaensis]|uniref:type IV secretory system conjugative DNA transfer family protein n=1 Tax=Erythrobacter donghaensis TaxID=267135 RepID=UPI000A3AAF09|nr:type IV secretory system conjugative DNA transfer family protein [Erythrobacter donghaensis]